MRGGSNWGGCGASVVFKGVGIRAKKSSKSVAPVTRGTNLQMNVVDLDGGVGPRALVDNLRVELDKEAHSYQGRAEGAVVDDL